MSTHCVKLDDAAAPSRGRRRVLILVQNLPVPFDRRVWLEATTLAKAGYIVSIICPKMKGCNRAHETIDGIEIFRYPLVVEAKRKLGFAVEFAWCFLLSALLSVRVALFGRGFDILHVCNPPETYWILGAVCRLFGKVFIFDHHDLSPELYNVKFGFQDSVLFRLLVFLERMTFRTAQLVIATNESHKSIAISRGGKRPADVYVVRSGPDFARLQMRERSPQWSRGRRFLVAYLGEICTQDGVEHLVRAMRVLRDDIGRDDVHCILMGGGPHQHAVAQYADEIGVGDLCTFTGSVSDEVLCQVLSSADIGVDPCPKNAWSDKSTMNKVGEYMFFGLALVAYDLCETRVSAGEAGAYAQPNQEVALATCIARLLDDPDARARMGEIAQQQVRDRLGWSHSEPVLLAAYDHAFRLKSPGARKRLLPRLAQIFQN